MKALLINGSPHAKGCTYTALTELKNTLESEGIEVELIHVGNRAIRGCIACRKCHETGKCVFEDAVNEVAPKLKAADAFVIGAPVYFASPAGGAISFMDRLFFSTLADDKTMKVGAAVTTWPPGRQHGLFRCAEQVFHHDRHAGGIQSILEHGLRRQRRRGEAGCGGPTDHAHPGPQYGLYDAGHPAGKGRQRSAPERKSNLYRLSSLKFRRKQL